MKKNTELKKKRIKQVFSSSAEVLHIWAAQTQEHARTSGRGLCYFFEDTCYSYGSHYKLGRIVTIKGKQVALINSTGYSHTTSKHIGEAQHATSHMLQIEVDASFDWKAGLVAMQGKLVDELFNTLNQRSFYGSYELWGDVKNDWSIARDFKQFNTLCSALGMKQLELHPPKELLELLQAHVDARIARNEELRALKSTPEYLEKREKARIAEENKRAAKSAKEIEEWMRGGAFTNAVTMHRPNLVRVMGDEVQTNTRASVPLFIAKRALMKFDNSSLSMGTKIGHYEFSGVDADGYVNIGCHRISVDQVRSVLSNIQEEKERA